MAVAVVILVGLGVVLGGLIVVVVRPQVGSMWQVRVVWLV